MIIPAVIRKRRISIRRRLPDKNAQGVNTGLKMDLLNALRILSENERTCITLQLMDGLSIDKIAEVTGMAQGTIKSHLSRGKQKLASYLKKNGYDR